MGYFKKIKQEVDADTSREITIFDDCVYLVFMIDYRDGGWGVEHVVQVFTERRKAEKYCEESIKDFKEDVVFKIEQVEVNIS